MPRQQGLAPAAFTRPDLPERSPALAVRRNRRTFTLADQVNQLVTASEADPDLGFMARMMALCSLPRTNPGNRHQYKRTNGPYKLVMVAGADNKLPFGNLPRLLIAWLCTEAVRTQNPEIVLGPSLSEFMRKLGIHTQSGGRGGMRTLIRNQMKRLFGCSVTLNYEDEQVSTSVNSHIAERTEFWWNRFGPIFAAEIRKKRMDRMRAFSGWRWHLDEMFVKINGEGHYLWRAVDQEGEVLEAFVSKKRDRAAALKFLRKLMKRYGRPDAIITDRLRSYRAALRELGGSGLQQAGRWLNNRAENAHLPFRRREHAMLRFRRMQSLQKFSTVHSSVYNHFNQARHLCSRDNFKLNRAAALAEWRQLVAA